MVVDRIRRRSAAIVITGALATVGVTGCATGQHAQTVNQVPAIDGVGADAGTLAIRAAAVTSPTGGSFAAGSDATLKLVIVNSGPDTVALRSVTVGTDIASGASLGLNGPAETSSDAPTDTTISIPSNSSVKIGYSSLGPTVTLTKLAQALHPTQNVPVTFNFSNGTAIPATLAVQISSDVGDAPTIDISPTGEG